MRAGVKQLMGIAIAAVLAMPVVAHAIPGGTVVITDKQLDPKSPSFEKDLKKAQKSSLTKQGTTWHLYFVAYLKKAAGAPDVNLVFYDVTGGKREQINAFPIGTQATAKIIMSDVELTPEMAFKEGHKYDVLITRLINGKEDVYARGRVELK